MISSKNCVNPVLNHFMGRVGATLAGVKPAELINVPVDGEKKVQWEEGKRALEFCSRLKAIMVRERSQKEQVFFLHREALDRTLREKPVRLFLKNLDYPENYSLERYVQYLLEKIKGSEFPHEIGVFLGYPLKDVLGYFGHPDLKLTEIKGWRYYGNGKISHKTYYRYKEARKNAKAILEKLEKQKAAVEIIKFWDSYTPGDNGVFSNSVSLVKKT